jgi:hypothetical protein
MPLRTPFSTCSMTLDGLSWVGGLHANRRRHSVGCISYVGAATFDNWSFPSLFVPVAFCGRNNSCCVGAAKRLQSTAYFWWMREHAVGIGVKTARNHTRR